jgi:energy-coupling factor transport system permease protein
MTIPFSLYAGRESGLHSVHPLTKLTMAGFVLAAALLIPWPLGTYALFICVVLPLGAWGRVTGLLLRAVVRLLIPFAISLFLIQGLFWTGGTPILSLGPLSLKTEGLAFALAMSGRILIIFSSFLWLAMTTRPDALMLALVEKGLPDRIGYIVLTTMQIVPRFQAKAATILNAQRSRGLETEGNILRRVRGVLPLVVPLILGSIVDIEERAIALEARAFSRQGEKTTLVDLPDSVIQRTFRWILIVMVIAIGVARVAGFI